MKKIGLEEIKEIELDILSYIADVCKENNLRYCLCGGTLLGAVRHKGFIPWDDDIDIYMPRPDYDKFAELLSQKKGKYRILSAGQENYYYNFAKVVDSETVLIEYGCLPLENMGVYVDIFPLEGMPSNEADRKKHFNKLDKLRKRINSYSKQKPKIRRNLVQYIKSRYLYCANKKSSLLEFQREYEKLVKKYNYDESVYVYATGGAYKEKDIFLKKIFSDYTGIIFENKEFNAPKECDVYLRQLYGNYMQLPPVENRISNHNYEAEYR